MKAEQLERYRKKLEELTGHLEVEIKDLQKEIDAGGLAVGDTDPHARVSKEAEYAIEKTEGEIKSMAVNALRRIEDGTFGKCEDCQLDIAAARLDAIPYTPVCIDCEVKREAN